MGRGTTVHCWYLGGLELSCSGRRDIWKEIEGQQQHSDEWTCSWIPLRHTGTPRNTSVAQEGHDPLKNELFLLMSHWQLPQAVKGGAKSHYLQEQFCVISHSGHSFNQPFGWLSETSGTHLRKCLGSNIMQNSFLGSVSLLDFIVENMTFINISLKWIMRASLLVQFFVPSRFYPPSIIEFKIS